MSSQIFSRLIEAAVQRGVSIAEADKVRYIRRKSIDDADLMAKADTSSQILSRSQKLVRVTWGENKYLVIFGIADPEILPLGVEYSDITPGIFASSVICANIFPGAAVSGPQIKDAIESDYLGIDGYDGHDLSAVLNLFPACLVFRVTSPEPYLESNHRFLGAVLSRSYTDGPLHISPDTLDSFYEIFESGPEFLPYENLLQGLLSFSWGNLFLEIYRCLEQLYAHPQVFALTSDWSSPLPLRDIAALLENHLSWRPKEDEALKNIIGCCDNENLSALCTAFNVQFSEDERIKSCESVARFVYKLRNNIVHYRPIHAVVSKTDGEWNMVVRAMLKILDSVYRNLGANFFRSSSVNPTASASQAA